MNLTPKQLEELDLVTRLLSALGRTGIIPIAGDRPDVSVNVDGKIVGIEVTQYHGDEAEIARSGRKTVCFVYQVLDFIGFARPRYQ